MTDLNAQTIEEAAPAVPPDFSGSHQPRVYFLANGNRIKIGCTTNLGQRVRKLAQLREHVELTLAGGHELESALHRRFAHLRSGASEWFRYAAELRTFVTAKRAAGGLERGYLFWDPAEEEASADMVGGDSLLVAAHLVTSTGKASTTMLQRRMKVGFVRASQMMNELEALGVVSPCDGPGHSRRPLLQSGELGNALSPQVPHEI